MDRLHLEGPRGFTLDNLGPVSPFFRHYVDSCDGTSFGGCNAGDRISLSEGVSGSDFSALVTLDGRTFRTGMQSDTLGEALIEFTGSFLVPSFTGVEAVSIVSPLSFYGSVMPPGYPSLPVELVGAAPRGSISPG